MKNLKKLWLGGILAILLVLNGCPESDSGTGNGNNNNNGDGLVLFGDVVRQMPFDENVDTTYQRWEKQYQDTDNLFDLSSMLSNNKVYIFTYSFSSNVDIDELSCYFYNTDSGWEMITDYAKINITGNITKNTKYSGKIVFVPNAKAAGCQPNNTYLRFNIVNKAVATQPTLYFYEFSLEEINKEVSLNEWTISGRKFKINSGTFAEELTTFDSKNNVLHIKPPYNSSNYGDFVMQYDLGSYAGQTIKIEMSMDVYLKKATWIAWQINSRPIPHYPVVIGACGIGTAGDIADDNPTGPALSVDTWHHITRTPPYIYTVPNTPPENDNGKILYLSGMQIDGAEAYLANAAISITENP